MRRDKKEVRSGQEAGFSAEPTRIDMQSSPRSLDETARQTSTGRRIVGVLASGLGRRSSSHYSPTGSPNSPSLLVKRQFAFPILAVLAVAALGLWLLLPGGALRAQETGTFEYAEKGTDPVATFTASDPEGATPIVWTLLAFNDSRLPIDANDDGDTTDDVDVLVVDAADGALFKINQGGVLEFKAKPNFEGTGDNEYHVMVQASDGATMTTLNWFKVTVNVTDVEEEGSIELYPADQMAVTLLQPQVGVLITAHSLMDPDGTADDDRGTATIDVSGDVTYKWYRTSSRTAMGTAILDDADDEVTTPTYTPQDTAGNSDVGSYLRVVATYTDGRGSNKTAEAVSEYVTIARVTDNTAPEFPAGNATRAVLEELPKGTLVGRPVTATDADSGEKLTYWLSGEGDDGKFDIDPMTGQLKVKTKLDYESDATVVAKQCTIANACEVTVSASDSSGEGVTATPGTAEIIVTITVVAVDEKPTFSSDDGAVTIEHAEGATELDTNLSTEEVEAATYTATDPEESGVTFTLSGDDADKFKLNDPATDDVVVAPMVRKVLEFKAKPDFEMPGDRNTDNVYQVTVVASDGLNSAMRDVTVKVTNMEEDGKLTVMPAQPRVGTLLTAELTDSDGVISGTTTWEWRKQMVVEADNCPVAADPSWEPADDPDTLIKDAKSATYTPVSDDDGYCLRVKATYVDGTEDTGDSFDRELLKALGKVQHASVNTPPEFASARTTRYVLEDAAENTAVGVPVTAKDAVDQVLSYTLGGTDAGSFGIHLDTGQITVGAKAKLDHETKPTHTVTVTATDTHNAIDTITVTIHVTDVDEAPMISDKADMEATAEKSVDYDEKGTGPVMTLTASDPEGATPIVWTLLASDDSRLDIDANDDGDTADDVDVLAADAADGALFKINQGGVLEFKAKPNFEGTGDNKYHVVVQASDGTEMNWFKVTVNVEDVEEEGSIKLRPMVQDNGEDVVTLLQPQVGVVITAASLMDPDGSSTVRTAAAITTGIAYKWYRTSSRTSMGTAILDDADNEVIIATYTPQATSGNTDVGMYLRVVATYTDGKGSGKTATAVSQYKTIAPVTDNTAPEFSAERAARAVIEEMPKGTAIGEPVTATDVDSGERLTYWLSGTGADDEKFSIDPMTGQLKVDEILNYDGDTGMPAMKCDDNACMVTVTAADPSGAATDTITVTITVTGVDEKPTVAGPGEIQHNEGGTKLATDPVEVTYAADDEDAATAFDFSLSGDDSDKFKLTNRVLAFKAKPDFEMPGDKNKDNVYEVTVEASDGVNTGMKNVTVKVTNIEEDGKLTVMPAQPRVGVQLTAELSDPDGVVSGPTWEWRKNVEECPADGAWEGQDSTATLIKRATSATYTPVAADDGACLRVKATYVDGTDDADDSFDETLAKVLDGTVQHAAVNTVPKFASARMMRYVPEDANVPKDAVVAADVGLPVTAKDADTDALSYTLGGADAGSFDIGGTTGQITVGAKAKLDHEDKPTHTVTVTATDPHGATDDIMVTIHVTDVDEAPMIMASDGGLAITGPVRVSRDEGSKGTVATYTAEGATLALSGDDAGDFRFNRSNGVLTFKSAPDYETPTDADKDNVYMVTLTATATEGDMTTTRDVTVTVNNVDEPGAVTAISGTARVDSELTAGMVTDDPDGSVSGERWTWERSMNRTTGWSAISGATSSTYTVMPGDVDYYLRVKVTYTDGQGSGKMATSSAMTAKVVAAGAVDPLVERYAGDDGVLQLDEVFIAIDDYFDYEDRISLEEIYELVDLYFES